jgi:integrase
MGRGLTVRAIEAIQPPAARREIADRYLPGLYLVVQPATGAKSWAVRYRHNGATRKLTLGSYPAIDLKAARELGAKALRTVAEGRDPGEEKAQARAKRSDSVDHIVEQFLERHCRRINRPKTAYETERLLRRHVLPRWHGRNIDSITRRDVLDVLDRVVDSGASIEANRTLAAVRKLFNWALSRDIIASSPCAGVKPPSAEHSRDRVLSDDELKRVLQAADKVGWPFGSVVKLLALTGQRRDEVGQMRWSEVDFGKRLWTLPRERMKANQPHEVALSAPAVDILKSAPRLVGADLVFSTNGATPASGYSKAKRRIDALLPPGTPHWTLHDVRRTVASGMARIGIGLPVVEKVLGHRSGSFRGVVGIYQRHDFANEKRAALEAWGNFVTAVVEGKPASKVVRLHGKQR